MRIAICDDCLLFCQQLADLIAQEQPEPEQDSVLLFSSGELLLQQFEKKHPFDLIFLDVEMGQGLSGMETAAEIRRLDDTVMLVFVIAYPDFVFKAFDVQAMHYFVKPVEQQEFHRLFQRCRRKYYDEAYRLPFRTRNARGQEELLLLMVKDIVYIESYLRKLRVHTVYGHDFEIVGKISDMEHLLCSRGFIRIHKSYLINLRYLYLIESDQLVLAHSPEKFFTTLPLSRRKREQVKKAFLQYKIDDL